MQSRGFPDMAIEIVVPRLGWSMDEGTFSQWLKQDGDIVDEGDALFELESDKAVQPVESFDAGILRISPHGPKPGDVVKVGQRLGYLCEVGEPVPDGTSLRAETLVEDNHNEPPKPGRTSASPEYPAQTSQDANGRTRTPAPQPPVASPSVRRLARQLGVDVHALETDNVDGRISAEQVLATADSSHEVVQKVVQANCPKSRGPLRVSPRAARAAARLGVNLADVSSTGTSGRICERDVLAAAAQQQKSVNRADDVPSNGPARLTLQAAAPDAQAEDRSDPAMSSLRRTIAARMLAAAQQTASVTLTSTADATELVNIRRQFKRTPSAHAQPVPSFTDMLVMLSAAALELHPTMLRQWDNEKILLPDSVDVAVAVDTPHGLLTPVLRDVPALSLTETSERLANLISRVRARRASPDELTGGTFTVSNLGGYRVDAFTPLLNLPQTAILGVGRISPQPTVVTGRVEVRDCVTLNLTFDHRVVDGAAAAALLTTICELVENPLPTLFR